MREVNIGGRLIFIDDTLTDKEREEAIMEVLMDANDSKLEPEEFLELLNHYRCSAAEFPIFLNKFFQLANKNNENKKENFLK